MKLGQYDDVQWEPWYRALGTLEQEWFLECAEKRDEDYQAVLEGTAELHRLRQRGMQRLRRQQLKGVA